MCGGRGGVFLEGEGWRRRVGGVEGGERRQKQRAKEEKMGTQRMPLAVDCPTCRVIASPTQKCCQELPSTETWGINIGDPIVNTH